ncbi:MAG: Sua5/YciO/YrdC/YwlC family protein [Clostridiales bacterium]|jgi:hydrogenase maturation protein HypF|nr:Sua5/YciO/YrdC/YwlC family protein [Clostridiales bacterium]
MFDFGAANTAVSEDTQTMFFFYSPTERRIVSGGGEATENCVEELKNSGIVAVKSAGGFLLTCSPFSREAVSRVRALTCARHEELFLAHPDIASIERVCYVSAYERHLLLSPETPILMLRLKMRPYPHNLCCGAYIGCSIPSGILRQITRDVGTIVFTYARVVDINRLTDRLSAGTVIHRDLDMLRFMNENNIPALTNEIMISRCAEETVIQYIGGKPIFLTRGRGYSQQTVALPMSQDNGTVLAVGSDENNAFCIKVDNQYMLSQSLGNAAVKCNLEYATQVVRDHLDIMGLPNRFAVDANPGCYSADIARDAADVGDDTNNDHTSAIVLNASEHTDDQDSVSVGSIAPNVDQGYLERGISFSDAEKLPIDIVYIQHHQAHVASVMAEQGLTECIGLAFDHGGMGLDGRDWGSEFFIMRQRVAERVGHLSYVTIPGDASLLNDARTTMQCFLTEHGLCEDSTIFSATLKNNINTTQTCSMGKLFDVAACLVGIAEDTNDCVASLEREVEIAQEQQLAHIDMSFEISDEAGVFIINSSEILRTLLSVNNPIEIIHGKVVGWYSADYRRALALGFYHAVSAMTVEICTRIKKRAGYNKVCVAGDMMKQKFFAEMLLKDLANAAFEVSRNEIFPPGDSSIAVGQAWLAREFSPIPSTSS